MSLPTPTLSSHLFALLRRLGWGGRGPRQLAQRARVLDLPFQPIALPCDSLWWQKNIPLERLVGMPHGALSGPVQEDKAQARAALLQLVSVEQKTVAAFDLRDIQGLAGQNPGNAEETFEAIAASSAGRQFRIISFKDFTSVLNQALPHHQTGETLQLKSAEWRGQRLFWCGEQQQVALACAITYARRRGLELTLPAQITHYSLDQHGLTALEQQYFMLAMPSSSWSNAQFMALLLDTGLPYARLSLLRENGAPEFLLLPKHNADSAALGEGLLQAGAADAIAHLQHLCRTHGHRP